MKIVHRQTPPDPEKPRKKKNGASALIVVLAVALVAGIGLVAVLDSMTSPEPADPDVTAPVNITTTQPSTTVTTTTTEAAPAAASTSKTTPPTQEEQPLYVLPLSNNVLVEYSDTPVWNDTLQSYRVHQAVDFGGKTGDKLVAITDSTVTAVYEDPLWGGCLELDCGYGIAARYCGITTALSAGETVTVGQAIGTLSDVPCEAATEPHLHIEVTVDGEPLDVLKAIERFKE